MIKKFYLEFVLTINGSPLEEVKSSLAGLGENLEISSVGQEGPGENDFKIKIETLDPALIFDTCSQFGRLKAFKID